MTLLLAVVGLTAKGQDVGLKTNLLSDAFTDINLGIEIGLAPRWTLNVGGEFNAWTFSHDRRWKHWGVEPEARYWFCDRFGGHFLALNVFTGQYNVGGVGKDFRFLKEDYEEMTFYTFNDGKTDEEGNLIPDEDPDNEGTAKTYTADDVNTDLDTNFNNSYGSDANAYTGGEMYYNIPIEHLNDDYSKTYTDGDGVERTKVLEGNYGVVRNHIYYVTITGLENLGHGIFDPDEVIVPQPDVDTYAIAADIHILAWKLVEQSVTL